MPDFSVFKQYFAKIKNKVTDKDFQRDLLNKMNPAPLKGSDYLADYIIRVLIFLFPLYIYENNAIMGISGKDVLFGIAVLSLSMYCVVKFFKNGVLDGRKVGISWLIMLGTFVLIAFAFAFQMSSISSEVPHTYLYIGCFLLPFCVRFVGDFRRYYLQLLTASFVILYISMYRYIFTGVATILGSEQLLSKPARLIPLLMLGAAVSSLLYVTSDREKSQKVYLVITAASLVLLFLYGDMTAFIMIMLFIMGLQFLTLPTVSFMKKNMILLFLFGFSASNAPLLTYFNTPGLNKEFDLEYSIYIDIIIAVAGLLVTSYWEKIPKDHDENHTLMSGFSRWYKRAIPALLGVILICFVFGSRGGKLKNAIGGKALSGFSTALWEAVSKSNGELWHVLSVYGIIGVVLMLLIGSILLRFALLVLTDEESSAYEKGLMLLTLLFVVQSFIYPYSATSTPEFLIFVGFSLGAQALGLTGNLAYARSKSEDLEPLDDGDEEDIGSIWIPGYVRSKLERDKELAREIVVQEENAASEEDNTSREKRFFRQERISRYVPRTVFLLSSAMAAALALLVVFAIYRVIVPVGKAGDTESMVKNAIELHQEQLLAQAELEKAQEEVLQQEQEDAAAAEVGAETAEPAAEASESKTVGVPGWARDKTASSSQAKSTDEKTEETAGVQEQEVSEEPELLTENEEEAAGEEETPASEDSQIEKGVSHGDYRIYDPNADYTMADEDVTGRRGSVNLRTIPRTDGDSVVVHALEEGEKVRRIGIGRNGWSKVEYEGQTLYAVTDYLRVVGKAPAEEEEEAEAEAPEGEAAEAEAEAEEATENPEEAAAAAEAEAQEEAPKEEAAAEASKTAEKPKAPVAYSMQWGTDNKSCAIWTSGQKLGDMTVTDGDGNTQSMTYFGTYYQGSGKSQKNYLYIYVPQGESGLSVNADAGFMEALKGMGYSGLYFNKNIINW